MRTSLALFCSCLLLGLTGCGATPDSLIKDQIGAMNDMADALEKNEPESRIADIKARMEQNNKKMEALKLPEDDKKKLLEKHKDELLKAMTRLQKAMMNRAVKDLGAGIPGVSGFGGR